MIKYFHELTKEEFGKLVGESKYKWGEFAEMYPQPKWCGYPDAVQGEMGCWSLMGFMVTGKPYCKGCDCLIKHKKSPTEQTDGK
jgi:hypothetical protein